MNNSPYTSHFSVLKDECISFLVGEIDRKQIAYFADLTFGGGGHSFSLLEQSDVFYLKSCDQDPDALDNGRKKIQELDLEERIELIDTNFFNFPEFVAQNHRKVLDECGGFQGILMDLGVSSHHFEKGDRGFSFSRSAPLDMRMDNRREDVATAAQIINQYSEEELFQIFSEYGEERFSNNIARNIVIEREKKRIETTDQLENIIFHSIPKKFRYGKINPSTKCFQALRIVVNRELDVLKETIPKLVPLLRPGGRLVIISFHSLEDRIVKVKFKDMAKSDISCRILTKKPVVPSENEIKMNSRSRSAKLRVIEKV